MKKNQNKKKKKERIVKEKEVGETTHCGKRNYVNVAI